MTLNPLALRERVEIPDRPQPTKAQKIAAWNREQGICWWCGKPVPALGEGVAYDHKLPRELSADDSVDNLYPVHAACHAQKTSNEDRPRIDKARRQSKLTGARIRKRHGLNKHPFLVKGIDGKVRERRK